MVDAFLDRSGTFKTNGKSVSAAACEADNEQPLMVTGNIPVFTT
jgi:hypothetical protein